MKVGVGGSTFGHGEDGEVIQNQWERGQGR